MITVEPDLIRLPSQTIPIPEGVAAWSEPPCDLDIEHDVVEKLKLTLELSEGSRLRGLFVVVTKEAPEHVVAERIRTALHWLAQTRERLCRPRKH